MLELKFGLFFWLSFGRIEKMKRGRVSAKSIQNESENNSRENNEIYQKAKQLKIVEEYRQHEQNKTTSLPDSIT